MYGVVNGVYYCNNDRVDELNDRIYARYVPDSNLRPNYDPRPVSTKYSRFTIIDPVIKRNVNLKMYNNYNTLDNNKIPFFYSGSNNGHVLRNVDLETKLRNQNIALQHGAPQGMYVPSSKSDLYHIDIPGSSNIGEQPFPELFNNNTSNIQNPTIPTINKYTSIGNSDFFNHTRTQLRNTTQI
jgi:hypothetical protein